MSSDNSSVDDDEYYNAKNFGKDDAKAKKEPKAKKEVVFETPVVETPVDETPVVKTPVDETPVVKTPVVKTPVDDDEYYNAKNFGKDDAKAKKEPKAGKEVKDDGDY
jgi:hypothetical protein